MGDPLAARGKDVSPVQMVARLNLDLSRLMLALAIMVGLSIQTIGMLSITALVRNHVHESRIVALDGTWQRRTVPSVRARAPFSAKIANHLRQWQSAWFPSVVSVSLNGDMLNDDSLRFLPSLTTVERLEICSDQATDMAIAKIASMPNLKQLTIEGLQFTAKGMLQLREANPTLEIEANSGHFSSIEWAVLVAELGVVKQNAQPQRPVAFVVATKRHKPSQMSMEIVESPL